MRDAGAEAHGASPGEGSGPRQGDPARSAATPRLELRGVYKAFGGVHVLEDVDFALASPLPPPERALEGVYEEGEEP